MANIKFSQFTANAGIDGNPSIPAGSGNSFLVGFDTTANSNNRWSFPQIAEGLSTHIPTIYTTNGTLAASRTVTMNAFDLNFASTTAGQQVSFEQNVKVGGQAYTLLHDIGTVATATWDINWDNSNVQAITLNNGGAMTLNTPTNPETGATYILKLIQGSSPSTVTWTSSIFKWASATPPVLSTSAGQIDIITLIYDGTNYYGSSVLNLS